MNHTISRRALLVMTAGLTLFAGGCTTAKRLVNATSTPQSAQAVPKSVASTQATEGPATMRTFITHADWLFFANDVDALASRSNLVVRGRVVDVSYFDFNTAQNTKVTLQVLRSSDPKISRGSTITVVEVGGVTTLANMIRFGGNKFNETITPAMEREKVQVLLEGAPLARVGDEAIYFLSNKNQIGALSTPYWDVVGAYQGKFVIKNGIAERYAPEDPSGHGIKPMRQAVDGMEREAAVR